MTRCCAARSAGGFWSGPPSRVCERRGPAEVCRRREADPAGEASRLGRRARLGEVAREADDDDLAAARADRAVDRAPVRRAGRHSADQGGRQAGRAGGADGWRRAGADVVITSPLQRAHRTAEAVAEAAGLPLVVYEELIEADFGAWQGLTFGEAAKKWPDELAAWMASPDAAPPGRRELRDGGDAGADRARPADGRLPAPDDDRGEPRDADQDPGVPGAAGAARGDVQDES